jgi:hypothetical protein
MRMSRGVRSSSDIPMDVQNFIRNADQSNKFGSVLRQVLQWIETDEAHKSKGDARGRVTVVC